MFQGNNVRDQDSDHALFAELGSSPASMEAAKLLDAFGSQPGFSKAQADAIQAYIQALFTGVPTWSRGFHFQETGGQSTGAKSFGNQWFLWF